MITNSITTRQYIFLTLIGLFVPSILIAHDHAAIHNDSSTTRKEVELLVAEHNKKVKRQLATQLLKSKPNIFDSNWHKNAIVSDFEKRELQLPDLITKCSRSMTAFGDIGLEWLLVPVSDYAEIKRRQTIVRSLVQDRQFFCKLRDTLSSIAKGENALLAYWDNEYINNKTINGLYFSMIPYADTFNKSSLALQGGYWASLMSSVQSLAFYLCFDAVIDDCLDSREKDINIRRALGKGARKLFKPFRLKSKLTEGSLRTQPNGTGDFSFKKILYKQLKGSAGDRFNLCTILFGNNIIGQLSGLSNAVGSAIMQNVFLLYFVQQITDDLVQKVHAIGELQKNLVDVASLIRALDRLEKIVSQSSLLSEGQTTKYLQHVMNKNNWSTQLKELMDLLNAFSFDTAGKKIFSAGQVLCAHKLLMQVKDELVPALQAVAEFDAYCSLSQLYNDHEDTETKFTFAEFVDAATPRIQIDACWEPLVSDRQPVVNDIYLGVNGKVPRMMITGPNGCGKSTFLKSLGHAVIMAQSWGIVPAASAQLTMFTGIRTSLDPKEDILNGISTFMAQRMRIGQVKDFVQTTRANQKILIMLDEPYRGTTDYLTEECVYDFGKEVSKLPYVVVCIATHVKKPVQLAHNGSFANYHVEIESLGDGEFKRLFTIAPGAADQWLNDRQWMKDFVYWLDRDMQRTAAIKKRNQ
jgi:energy-coupling factor transporter ATP-binding protein EcfA2